MIAGQRRLGLGVRSSRRDRKGSGERRWLGQNTSATMTLDDCWELGQKDELINQSIDAAFSWMSSRDALLSFGLKHHRKEVCWRGYHLTRLNRIEWI